MHVCRTRVTHGFGSRWIIFDEQLPVADSLLILFVYQQLFWCMCEPESWCTREPNAYVKLMYMCELKPDSVEMIFVVWNLILYLDVWKEFVCVNWNLTQNMLHFKEFQKKIVTFEISQRIFTSRRIWWNIFGQRSDIVKIIDGHRAGPGTGSNMPCGLGPRACRAMPQWPACLAFGSSTGPQADFVPCRTA